MKAHFPLRVAVMDDDDYALQWLTALLARDLRTHVIVAARDAITFLEELQNNRFVDLVLLDAEYEPQEPELAVFIRAIRKIQRQLRVICLSQYGQRETFLAALNGGANSFLLKHEVQIGIASVLALAQQASFLVTPGVMPLLAGGFPVSLNGVKPKQLPTWQPAESLTPQLRQVFTLRVLYGLSAEQTARETHLAVSTVEKYIHLAYQRLSSTWDSESLKIGLDGKQLPPEVLAYHRYSLLPE
jgi:DNA-binding NarL/FixJ family response regulator